MSITETHAVSFWQRKQLFSLSLVKRLTVISLLLAVTTSAIADEASSLYRKGRDVEERLDYEAAFTYYTQAYQLKPKNLTYRTASIRVRVLAASQHVHRGQQLRDEGHLEEAMVEFQKAALTDPSSFIAQQEIQRTRLMLQSTKATGASATAVAKQISLQKNLEAAAGPVELHALSVAPLTLKLTEDAKVIYSTLGKLAGINVVFDPDFKPPHISVELVKVTLEEALHIVEMESKSFVRPVTKNTIYVAADTPTKRKEIEQSVMQTFYLSNVGQASDLTDIATTIRSTLDLTRITPLPSQGALIVRGTPDQLTLVQKLIDDMDKARPEVIVEVLVMQVTRDRIRDLGIQPPTSASLSFLGLSTSNGSSSTSSGSSGSTVSLNDLKNLSASDFAVTIPQVTATALFSDSHTTLIQNPQIRALDGQRASLRIGQRYPIATGSYSSGVGTTGLSPLVSTQFQYIDVGVNIDITPWVHMDNEVSLKVVLDITAVDSVTTIGGISQPVIGQRKIEHVIRLKDGEINLLGGMLQEGDTKSLSGLPWLSNIPLLRYFFSSEQTDKQQNELVFVLIPHIIRGQELNDANYKEMDVGTSNTIELRHTATPQPSENPPRSVTTSTSEAIPAIPARDAIDQSAALAKFELSAQKSSDALPNAAHESLPKPAISSNTNVDSTSARTASVSLGLSSPQQAPTVGETFMVDVLIDGAQNLLSVPLDVQYDASKIQLLNVYQGTLLAHEDRPILTNRDDPASGMARITASLPPNTRGVSGKGTLVTLRFSARAAGQAIIGITGVSIKDGTNHFIPASSTKATINIRTKA